MLSLSAGWAPRGSPRERGLSARIQTSRHASVKAGEKGKAALKTNRRAGLIGVVLRLWVARLAEALVGPGEDEHVGGPPGWTLPVRLPMEETTLRHGMMPTLVWCSQPRKSERDAHGAKKGKRKR